MNEFIFIIGFNKNKENMLSRSIRRVLPLNRRFLCNHRDDLDKIRKISELNSKIQRLEDENNQITKMLKSNQKILAGTTIVIWILIFFVKSK